MKAVIQRVSSASVCFGQETRSIMQGITVLLAIEKGDTSGKNSRLLEKLINLKIFNDQSGKMNNTLLDINGSILLISNFTVCGSVARGRRPDYSSAMPVKEAEAFFMQTERFFSENYSKTVCGKFQAIMQVNINNDGPVTFIISL
ncbi:MAG: D-tyrosyl-tRNA(Tyr) deacylase [Spirochaetes bacterium GWF1_41_5]|nr:MAG: D-tyrosyl-tRNA(Tyr) deacylase [Spirochaetes bacterium GWF1_41_5]HBE02457.1 D-tyrosyl-tRNA(Tyr) deacylase [Spirochaetia bacterium]